MPTGKKSQLLFQAAFPHTPIQDQFGQQHLIFGVNKLEYLSALVAPGFIAAFPNALPEVVAEQSMEIAESIIVKCAESLAELHESENATPRIVSLEKK